MAVKKFTKLSTLTCACLFPQAKRIFCLVVFLVVIPASIVFAWPTDSQWIPLPKGGTPILDNHLSGNKDGDNDATGSVNVVPYSGSTPAAYIYNDGSYLFYRIRLDQDPTGSGGQGILKSFGWGFEIDTDQNADDYEWLIMCDGISSPEIVSLRLNTDKTGVGDPSDKAEFIAAEYPMVGNHRILTADTSINGDQDYFLDFRIPYAVFLSATGITENTLVRYFVGSSNSTNNLTEQGADLLAGSDLYSMASDFVTPTGYLPRDLSFYDGTINFVEDLGGFGDVNMATTGDTLYISVFDLDLDAQTNPSGTVRITLSSTQTGDTEVLILNATGVQGKYTGLIATSATDSNGILQVTDEDTVTATYADAIAADLSQSVARTDTLLISSAYSDLSVSKSVNDITPDAPGNVIYTITVTNKGPNNIDSIDVTETLPSLSPKLVFNSATLSQGTYTYNTTSGLWSVGDLDAGASAILTLNVDIDVSASGGSFTNNASITNALQDGTTSSNVDPYPDNNSDTATVSVDSADLRLTKSVVDDQRTVGDEVTYQLRVYNLGPNDATNIIVNDTLPAGVSYNSASGDGSFSGSTWTVGDLIQGTAALLFLTVNVDSGTSGATITNTAEIQAPLAQPDPDLSNNSDSANIQIDYLDLALSKSVSDETPDASDFSAVPPVTNTVTYTIEVTNNGPHDASGVQVTDQLPTGVTFQSYSAVPATSTYNSTSGIWDIGDIADQDVATLSLVAVVDEGTTGQTIINSAEITSLAETERNPLNDTDRATIDVSGTDIQVIKSVDDETPSESGSIVYTVTVINNGPNGATGIQVTDILPGSNDNRIAGVSYVSASATQGTYDGKSTDWVWDIGTLGVLNSATLTINATVETGTAGLDVVNTAMVTAADQADPDGTNNAASALIAVDGTDLAVAKSVDESYPNIGDFVTYTITVANNGPGDATNVDVTDLIPPELIYNSATVTQGSYSSTTGIWDVGSLTYNSFATLSLNAEVRNEDRALVITNNTSITAMDQGDQESGNDSASADIYIGGTNLELTKTVSNATPSEGDTITYSITAKNTGNNAATSVEVEDILPSGVTYVSHSAPAGTVYSAGLWIIPSIEKRTSAYNSSTLTIDATVDAVNPFSPDPTITNTAELVNIDQLDSNSSDDIASVDIVPTAAPSLTIVKSANGKVNVDPGEAILYTLTITNSGSAAAHNIVVTDAMSPYTALAVDPYINGTPFTLGGDSGLSIQTIEYANSTDGGGNPIYTYTLADGGGGAPSGYDGSVTHWRITMDPADSMDITNQFTIDYQMIVK